MRIGIVGPESTGKSTLAQSLVKRLHGTWVPEYARQYVEQKGSTEVSYEELCSIARQQIAEMAQQPDDPTSIIVYDTELIITKVWFDYAFHRVPEWLEEAIRRYPMDIYLLCLSDIAWQPDPARTNGSDAIRMELLQRYEQEIRELGIPYYFIRHQS